MTLIETILKINSFDEDHTIYVSRPWSSTSDTVICQEPEDGSLPANAVGMEYFLEVYIIKELLEGFNRENGITSDKLCDLIIQYAENDA